MSPAQAYRVASGLWSSRGRPSRQAGGLWTPGAVEPHLADLATSAASVGARLPRSSMTVVTTDPFNPVDGTAYTNTVFTGKVTTTANTGGSFTDCFFAGSNPTTGEGGQVDTRLGDGSSGKRWTFTNCTFTPDAPNAWTNNIIGHHFTLVRCLMRDGVDNVGSYNTNGPNTANEIYGCYLDRQSWYYPDPTGVHTDGTHNDGIQHQGGVGLRVVGNSIHGYIVDKRGNSKTVPNPLSSSPNYDSAGQGVLVQQNVTASDDVHINKNWLYGWASPIKLFSAGGIGNVEAVGNRLMDFGQKDFGGSQHYYWIRFDSGVTLNGATYTGGNAQQLSPNADDNRWGVAGTNAFNTVAVGDLIHYRVDT